MLTMPRAATRKIELQSKHHVDESVDMGDKWYIRYLTLSLEIQALERLRSQHISSACPANNDMLAACDCESRWINFPELRVVLAEKIGQINQMHYEERAKQFAPVADFIWHANRAFYAKQAFEKIA